MSGFSFYHPVEVRYGDLDPQGHLNNAKYLTFMEQARIQYIKHLGLWTGDSFIDIGMILADAQISFLQPIHFGQSIEVGVRTLKLGNKSFHMAYELLDTNTGRKMASGSTVQVAFDYRLSKTISIPDEWRTTIGKYENIPFHSA